MTTQPMPGGVPTQAPAPQHSPVLAPQSSWSPAPGAGVPPRAAGQSSQTRITVVSGRSRADLVLPADEPIGLLLPDLARLVAGAPRGGDPRRLQLSLTDGRQLLTEQSLAAAGVVDGTVVRLSDVAEAAPPAVVYDVADEVTSDLENRRDRWNADVLNTAANLCIGFIIAALAVVLAREISPLVVAGIVGVIMIIGLLLSFSPLRRLGFGICCGSAAGVAAALWSALPLFIVVWLAMLCVAGCLVAYGGAYARIRSAGLSAITLVGFLLLWLIVGVLLPWDFGRKGQVMAVISVFAIGLLPRIVIQAAGLTRLDTQRAEQKPVSVGSVAESIRTAHRSFSFSLAIAAFSAMIGGALGGSTGSPWAMGVALATVIILVLRVRAVALIAEGVVLLIAAAGLLLATFVSWQAHQPSLWWLAPALAVLLAIGAFVIVGNEQDSAYEQAIWRRIADIIELVAAIALVPLLIGGLGVYAHLLSVA